MLAFALTCGALFMLAMAGAGDPFVMVVVTPFPAAVGYYWARGETHRALVLILGVAAMGLMAGSFGQAVLYAIGAGAGVFYTRGWTFGRVTASVTAVLAGVTLVIVLGNADGILENASDSLNTFMRARADVIGEAAAANDQLILACKMFEDNLQYLGLGHIFGLIVLSVTFFTALVSWRLRRAGVTDKVRSDFSKARMPDWLVWAAIVLALLWFAEDRWPNEALRTVTWNGALALSYIYALNGYGLLIYCLRALGVTGFWFYFPVATAFMLGSHAISIVGFFDTWWEFRQRVDKLAAARRAMSSRDDN